MSFFASNANTNTIDEEMTLVVYYLFIYIKGLFLFICFAKVSKYIRLDTQQPTLDM